MRILHIAEAYHPAVGGVPHLMRKLSEAFVARGHEVTVATAFHPARNYNELNGVKIKSFAVTGKVDLGYNGEIEHYQKFVRSFPCDLLMIYAAQTWSSDLIFPLLDEMKCAKVFSPCGFSSIYNPDYASYFEQMPAIMRKFDHIIYISNSTWDAQFGHRHGIKHFTIAPEGADLTEFSGGKSGFRQKYGIRTKYMFLNVATYNRNKGHAFILEAFWRRKSKDATMVFIGSKPHDRKNSNYLRMLRILSSIIEMRTGWGTVRFLTDVERSWVVRAFYEADLFLFGSTLEVGIPIAIHEAMAAGVPYISSRCGSVEELDGGFVVVWPYEMWRGIEILLKNDKLRESFAKKGVEAARRIYGLETTTNIYEDVYQKALLNMRHRK
jgi:glycosyltransferase involved in cell wall biosynthesis